MGLIRALFLMLVVWIVFRLLARALRGPGAPAAGPRKSDPEYIPLTRCSVCGAHIPQPRAGAAPICERCRSG